MWKKEEIDLGNLKVGQVTNLEFEFDGPGIYKSSKVSCGCTSATWHEPTRSLKTTYTPKPVPAHLKAEGKKSYTSNKTVTLQMLEDGEVKEHSLKFKAVVYE